MNFLSQDKHSGTYSVIEGMLAQTDFLEDFVFNEQIVK